MIQPVPFLFLMLAASSPFPGLFDVYTINPSHLRGFLYALAEPYETSLSEMWTASAFGKLKTLLQNDSATFHGPNFHLIQNHSTSKTVRGSSSGMYSTECQGRNGVPLWSSSERTRVAVLTHFCWLTAYIINVPALLCTPRTIQLYPSVMHAVKLALKNTPNPEK
ncbi:hypothetical protein B0H13DRAFT_1908671 [Mycena leptocephala]|nr:hypothetical protein B0H13DRAFT_1908671 [Mycena leptocephala]